MNYTIRNMQSSDLDIAAQIFYEAFNSVGEKWNLETAKKRIEQYYSPEMCWVVADENEILGILVSKLDNVLDHQELYIDIIAVNPKIHEKGIGKKLLEHAENYAKEHKLGGMWLCASSKLPSFNWYLKTNFVETSWKVLFKKL